jgi:hypothetical protein
MSIRGTLTSMSVPDLLQFLAQSRKTGTLKFSRNKVIKQIYFDGGMIVGSQTNDPKEYLGQVLLHYGKIEEPQLQEAMEVQRKSGGKLGEILVSLGYLKEADVTSLLQTRTLEIIYDLFHWKEAHFEFFDNEPVPEDLARIQVDPNNVVMEGIYRVDEMSRYREAIPSDRSVLELCQGWTASVNLGKEVRQILFYVEKRMPVVDICYHMHSSRFHVYGQLFELVSKGVARVNGEAPVAPRVETTPNGMPETVNEMIWAARAALDEDKPDKSLSIVHLILEKEPKNTDAQALLVAAEAKFAKQLYASDVPHNGVPKIIVPLEGLELESLGAQEGFVLSRINGEWDIQSILSICPFREADSLRMIKTLLDKGIIAF